MESISNASPEMRTVAKNSVQRTNFPTVCCPRLESKLLDKTVENGVRYHLLLCCVFVPHNQHNAEWNVCYLRVQHDNLHLSDLM